MTNAKTDEVEETTVATPVVVPRRRSRVRRGVALLVACSLSSVGLVLAPMMVEPAAAASKVLVCHRTHSTTNPYRLISVSQSAATNNNGHKSHGLPNGSSNPTVFDPSFSYASNNKYWSDIIPNSANGGAGSGFNWSATNAQTDFSNKCASLSAKQFYDIETTDGGQTAQDVIDDLNEQGANEDAALLASLPGGVFTTSNVSSWDTSVAVSTSAATSVGSTTATLNGAITVGAITTAIGFDYGTSSTLATFTSVSAGSNVSSVSSQAISKALTGLTAGTTYYFRATGTTNAGTDTEGILYGSIMSFTTTGSTAQSITFNQPSNMALGDPAQSLTNTTANTSGLTVTFTSTTTSVCTVSGAAVTAVTAGTCSITASQAGDSTYAPATSVTRTFTITGTSRTLTIDANSYNAGGYALSASPPTITSTASAGDSQGTKSYNSTTTSVCTINSSSGVVAFVSAGTCTIGASITSGGVYNAATASTISFTLTAASRTLSIDSGWGSSYALNASPPTISSTASAGDSQGTKSYNSTTTSVCTINSSSGVVAFVSAGTCTIGASITSGGIYNAATATTISFTVTAASRTLAIDGGSYNAGGYALSASPPTITSTASAGDSQGTKSYNSTTTSVCTINSSSGVVAFVSAGTCTIGASITSGGIYNSATATNVSFVLSTVSRTLAIDGGSYDAGGYAVDASPPTITSTASAGDSQGTKSYNSTTTSVCTINSSGVVTLVSAGTCVIGAAITTGGIYNSATASTISFDVRGATTSTTTPTTIPPSTSTTVPTTSTTIPPTTSTTVPTAPAGPVTPVDGTVQGVVWFDRNHNQTFDGREWILPGIRVTLTQILTPAAAAVGDTGALRSASFHAEAVTAAATPVTFTTVTDKDGHYTFTNLPFANYEVSAVAHIKGFDYTSDSDGGLDWSVGVDVASSDKPGIADFAGLGKGEIVGQMFEQSSHVGLSFATIRCMWGGYDDVLGNADDVPFELTADKDGGFDMSGIPYGNFTCSGLDSAGRHSASVFAAVFSPDPKQAPLPVGKVPSLPNTGAHVVLPLVVGLLAIGLGCVLVVIGRRRFDEEALD